VQLPLRPISQNMPDRISAKQRYTQASLWEPYNVYGWHCI